MSASPVKTQSVHGPRGRTILTRREREVCGLLGPGRTNKIIARQLGLSPGTIREYLQSAYKKLGVHKRAQAATAVAKVAS